MTDLGLYNFIKSALSQGKTKAEITTTLLNSHNWDQAAIDQVFLDVETNNAPVVESDMPKRIETAEAAVVEANGASMTLKAIIGTAIIVAIVFGFTYFSPFSSKPSPAAIEDDLRTFVMEEGKKDCQGQFTVQEFSDVTVGEYVRPFKGWAVYVNKKTRCQENDGNSFTYNGTNDVKKQTITAFVHKSGSSYVIFMPDMVREAQEQMSAEVDRMFQNAF